MSISKIGQKTPQLSLKEKRKYVAKLIETKGDRITSYQSIRPEVTRDSAKTMASQLSRDFTVQKEYQLALSKSGLSIDQAGEYLHQAIRSGLGKKATNKDAISGLRLMMDMVKGEQSPDLEALRRLDLKEQSQQELMNELDKISKEIGELRRQGAIEGEIVA
jgi:hypothetical protein